MTTVLVIAPLAAVLWLLAWMAGLFGTRLPKRSWWRLILSVFVICGVFGIPMMQLSLLTIFVSDWYAHEMFDCVLGVDVIPALVLLFSAAIREGRAKKRSAIQNIQS